MALQFYVQASINLKILGKGSAALGGSDLYLRLYVLAAWPSQREHASMTLRRLYYLTPVFLQQ